MDATKITQYALVGTSTAKISASKIGMYALIDPTGSPSTRPRVRKKVTVHGRLIYGSS
jgi:hypothetical protein